MNQSALESNQIFGTIFNIQRFSVQDGPGVRTVVFLKGCPLNCKWCCNPESKYSGLELLLQRRLCINCKRCVEVCPKNAITKGESWWRFDRQICDLCGKCAEVCHAGAISLVGEYISAGEVVKRILRDKLMYINSGGGVTLSGGEPTTQLAFSHEILKRCKTEKLHTAIETCGYAPWESYETLLGSVDLFLFDIKLMDEQKHQYYTGTGNQLIQENFRRLIKMGKKVIARYPMIPGVNTDDQDILKMREFLKDSCAVEVHLLPYHKLGINKYASLDLPYQMNDTPLLDADDINRIKENLDIPGIKIVIYNH